MISPVTIKAGENACTICCSWEVPLTNLFSPYQTLDFAYPFTAQRAGVAGGRKEGCSLLVFRARVAKAGSDGRKGAWTVAMENF